MDPCSEEEKKQQEEYEQGKQRLYELHQQAEDLFYVEEAGFEGESVSGECIKGSFLTGDTVLLLDETARPLMQAEITMVRTEESTARSLTKSEAKVILFLSWKEEKGEKSIRKAQFLIKKQD